jgi:hypothetical protein
LYCCELKMIIDARLFITLCLSGFESGVEKKGCVCYIRPLDRVGTNAAYVQWDSNPRTSYDVEDLKSTPLTTSGMDMTPSECQVSVK